MLRWRQTFCIKECFVSQKNGFRLLTENARLVERLSQYKLPMALFNMMPLDNNIMSHIRLQLPPEMEEGKKYPMIVRVYSGPGTYRVKDSFDLGMIILFLILELDNSPVILTWDTHFVVYLLSKYFLPGNRI